MSNFIERTIVVLESLETENAKLRDERERMYKANVEKNGEILRLLEENAKLREFASEAFSMAFNFYHGAGTAEDLRELEAEYHELGIEVDE